MWLGFANPKLDRPSPGKIRWTGKYNGEKNGEPYSSNYEIVFEIDGDNLTMTRNDKISAETAIFKRLTPADADASANHFIGGWRAVKGTVKFPQNGTQIPMKTGKLVLGVPKSSQGRENNVAVGIAGNVYYEKGKSSWFEDIINFQKIFITFDENSPKTISWSEDRNFFADGKRSIIKASYKLDLNDDGTMTVKTSNKYVEATVTLKKEF
jgi:hypothetical protein